MGCHMTHPRLVGIQPCQERRPGGAAPGAVVHLGEPYPFRRHPVQVWRGDLRAEAADIGIAHIVCKDQNDVRAVGVHQDLLFSSFS